MGLTLVKGNMIQDGTVTSADMAVDPRNASNFNSGDVPLAQLDNAPTTSITQVEDEVALLGFKIAANGTLAKYNLVDQTVDAFEDGSGIDASASTGEVRDASGKYYSGSASAAVTATGGTITTDGDYTIHSFTATGASTFTTDTAQSVDLLVVAAGGGGGGYCGGGGGAGGYISTIGHSVTAASHSITVGVGGAGGSGGPPGGVGGNGGNSQFGSMTAAVGGGGGKGYNAGAAADGGSGGGSTTTTISSGTAGQGNAGGTGSESSSQSGGGGGGAGAVGGNGEASGVSPNNYGGPGGVGLQNSITGTATYYAGGGGGGRGGAATTPASGGTGGLGGGGNGSSGANPAAQTPGTANTGGGGGGGGHPHTSGAGGGSGIVILRRPTSATTFGDMSLVSNSTTAEAAPTKGSLVMTYTNGTGTAVINTDITAEFSADNGSTYTSMTLASQGTTGGHTILTANDVTRTSTSGTSMRYRIKTLNQSASKSTRIQAVSLGWA